MAAGATGVVVGSGHHRSSHRRGAAGSSAAASARAGGRVPVPRTDAKLLGQRLMVGFDGTRAPRSLLSRVRAGRVGGVILFGSNLASRAQTRALTASLQRAARAGHNPRLLIATDQEGGEVKRLPGPPDLTPGQMAAAGPASARRQGRATARLLRSWGIEMDLAPVADVPTSPSSFIGRQGRAFSTDAATTARDAAAFAQGLQSARVAATGKHFPGLGSARVDTDSARAEQLRPTAAQRAAALMPYRTMIGHGLDAVMAADAGFPAYDRSGSVAALSAPIIGGLLRGKLHFGGVVITDDLGANTGHSPLDAGVDAARAGADVLLYPGTDGGELTALRRALRRGTIRRAAADASYRRIIALKRRLGLA